MYTPPAFREDDPAQIRRIIREARLSTLVTATPEGLIATPLPLILDESEGEHGVLYGHLAKAKPVSIPRGFLHACNCVGVSCSRRATGGV